MKMRIELDDRIPETVRINAEWRLAFQLSRYSTEIDSLHIRIIADDGTGDTAFQCIGEVQLQSNAKMTFNERSDQPSIAVSTTIDRIASSVGRLVRRHTRISGNKGS